MNRLVCLDLGRRPYLPVLRAQERLVERVRSAGDGSAYLLLVEHDPPVITLGRRATAEHILASADDLAARGIEVHQASRGGLVTCHPPGQLVGYPILALLHHGLGLRQYLRALEEVLLRLLDRFGVRGRRIDGLTGVWVGDQKVAAIGVAVRRWVSYHGLALNVCPDLGLFDAIVPCGIGDRGVTSLQRLLGRPVTVDEVKAPLIECMLEVFGFAAAEDKRGDDLLEDCRPACCGVNDD